MFSKQESGSVNNNQKQPTSDHGTFTIPFLCVLCASVVNFQNGAQP